MVTLHEFLNVHVQDLLLVEEVAALGNPAYGSLDGIS